MPKDLAQFPFLGPTVVHSVPKVNKAVSEPIKNLFLDFIDLFGFIVIAFMNFFFFHFCVMIVMPAMMVLF